MVTDGGASYAAKKDVPANTALTNTEYWQKLVETVAGVEIGDTATYATTELLFNPEGTNEHTVPEVDDDSVSEGDTWSSSKINGELSDLKSANSALLDAQNSTEFDVVQLATSVNPTGWRQGIWSDAGKVVADDTSICLTGRIGVPGGNRQRVGMKGLYVTSTFGTIELKKYRDGSLIETVSSVESVYVGTNDGDMLSVSIKNLISPSSDYIDNGDISGAHVYLLFKPDTKKEYAASEYFYVSINKTWIDGSADSVDTVDVDCVLQLPKNYSPGGEPVRLIFMHHGNSGTVNVQNKTWYSEVGSWKTFVNAYLNAGYAVFDVNGCGPVTDTNASHDYGAFGALQAAYKAYQHICRNYNVKSRIFVHGSSMGGATAYAFAKAFGGVVDAIGLFAPALLPRSAQLASAKEYIAVNYGYADSAEMVADGYSHLLSATPCIQFFDSGTKIEKPYTYDWVNTADGYTKFCADFKIPVKIWCGTADDVVDIQYGNKLAEAIKNAGGLAIYRAVDGVGHTGAIGASSLVNSEAVMWFDRF